MYSPMIRSRDLTTIKDELRNMIALRKFYLKMPSSGSSIADTIKLLKSFSNVPMFQESTSTTTTTTTIALDTSNSNTMNSGGSSSMSNVTVSRDDGDDDNAMSIANSVTNVIPAPNHQPTSNTSGVRLFVRWSDAEIDALKVISRDPNFKAGQRYDGNKIRIQMIRKGYPDRAARTYCRYISQYIKADIEKKKKFKLNKSD